MADCFWTDFAACVEDCSDTSPTGYLFFAPTGGYANTARVTAYATMADLQADASPINTATFNVIGGTLYTDGTDCGTTGAPNAVDAFGGHTGVVSLVALRGETTGVLVPISNTADSGYASYGVFYTAVSLLSGGWTATAWNGTVIPVGASPINMVTFLTNLFGVKPDGAIVVLTLEDPATGTQYTFGMGFTQCS